MKQVLKKLKQEGYAVTGHTFNRNSKLIKIFCSREGQNFCIKFYLIKKNNDYVIEGYTVKKLESQLRKHTRKKFIRDKK